MLQKPKGTYDIYGKRSLMMNYLKEVFSNLIDKYNAS